MDGIPGEKAKQKLKVRLWAKQNPFLPGSGTPPPHLAGREEDLAVFQDCLVRLWDRGKPAPGPMVLFAPRGAGKTALMQKMESAVKDGARWPWRKAPALCNIDPLSVSSGADLVHLLAHELSGGMVTREQEVSAGLEVNAAVAKGGGGVRESRDLSPAAVSSVIAQHARHAPLLIMVDEAHTLTEDAGSALLQGEQSARRAGAKVQMVLAGTPDLKDHLGRMRVSFWDRLGKRLRHLNLLGREDACASIAKPFASKRKTTLDEDAKGRIFELTSGYPYFLQVMGESLWNRTPDDVKIIARSDVDRAEPEFLRGKNSYYQRRYEELDEAGMVGPAFASAVAHKRLGAGFFDKAALREAARRGAALGIDGDDITDAPSTGPDMCRFLLHKGFMWGSDETSSHLEPGIPTLMDFVCERVMSKHANAEERLLKDERFNQLIDASSNPSSRTGFTRSCSAA